RSGLQFWGSSSFSLSSSSHSAPAANEASTNGGSQCVQHNARSRRPRKQRSSWRNFASPSPKGTERLMSNRLLPQPRTLTPERKRCSKRQRRGRNERHSPRRADGHPRRL